MNIIGREAEKKILADYYDSHRPEFVAVYGRRRVGKTFLIREFFENDFFFYASGLAKSNMTEQLQNFSEALSAYGADEGTALQNWQDAFHHLRELVLRSKSKKRKVIFLDELPWFDTPKSKFLPAFEHFWNAFASARPDILLIVCGSATSWIIKNLINDRGGLHNRLTGHLSLEPFSLKECEAYYKEAGIVMTRYSIAEAYMIFGGIPYYLSLMKRNLSLPQNVDAMCFAKNAELRTEFSRLYSSLFVHSEQHVAIVRALAEHSSGITRDELTQVLGISDGGGLTKTLGELEQCGFISRHRDFTRKQKGHYYRLIDFFTLFYLKFMSDDIGRDERYWSNNYKRAALNTWRGNAFERVCLTHVMQIRDTLGIAGVSTATASWRSKKSDPGAQIDLLLDREDNVINVCEIKYAGGEFAIDKPYNLELRNKEEVFRRESKTRKALHTTMVTTFGLVHNAYRSEVQSEVTLDDLFCL
jgi:AAA+ ATPase superfamily predicted ATPase